MQLGTAVCFDWNESLLSAMGVESRSLKVAVLGAAGVGKSAMIVRFITGRFLHRYDPTLEDEYSKKVEIEGENYTLSICDTAGQDSSNIHYYASTADVLLLAFSLTEPRTLEVARTIREQTSGGKGKQVLAPAVLVGTKLDLKKERQVEFSEALATARELGCSYVETSAAADIGVFDAFATAVRLVMAVRAKEGEKGCGCTSGFEKKLTYSAKRSVKGLLHRLTTAPYREKKGSLMIIMPALPQEV